VSTDIIESSGHQLVSRGNASPEQLAFQTQTLMEIYRRIMQKDTDYGVIPGTPKPSLYQPGAQILRLAAGLGVEMEHTETDRNLAIGWISHSFTCRLTNADGVVVGICEGSANSYEDRYRWRWLSERDLPKGIDKESLVSKKRTGKYNEYHVYRVENDNPAGLDNTLIKIAQKRAFVGAVLMATGASRIFTQDVEDATEDDGVSPEVEAQRPGPKAKAKAKQETKPDPKADTSSLSAEPGSATAEQTEKVAELLRDSNGAVTGILQQRGWKLARVGDLSEAQADIIIRLMNGEAVA